MDWKFLLAHGVIIPILTVWRFIKYISGELGVWLAL